MESPEKTLPRAMITAILLVMLLYVAVSFAVFGNLAADEVIAAKDFALAQAAMPVFGPWGFVVVAVSALVSTASSINANLYAVTNITYQMARDGELPAEFGKKIANSREGLVISGLLVVVLSILFDLSEIAAIGSISILFIHFITHVGHLKLITYTRASRFMVFLAALITLTAMVLSLVYVSRQLDQVIAILIGFALVAFITEVMLQKYHHREILPRKYTADIET